MTYVFKEREGREDRNFFQKQETDFQQYCELKSKYQNWTKGIISSQYLLATSDSIPKLFDKTIFVLFYLYFYAWEFLVSSLFPSALSKYCIIWLLIWYLHFSYLELALLPCWRYLLDRPLDCLPRLVMMTRGLADPLASAYCRLYMAHCIRKLHSHDIGIHLFFCNYW